MNLFFELIQLAVGDKESFHDFFFKWVVITL